MRSRMMTLFIGLLILVLAGCGPQAEEADAPADADLADAATPELEIPTEAPPEIVEEPSEEETPEEAAEEDATDAPTEASEGGAETGAPAEEEAAQGAAGERLQAIIDRGELICGINGGLPGFSNLEADGSFSGFDVDFCRAVAAAILGDPEAVEYRPLSAQERFAAVQSGEIDVLFRNTTWTLDRDTSNSLDFGPVTFYDGQGIMVQQDIGVTDLEGLSGATICVLSGTTTELNLTDQFRALGIEFEPLTFEEIDPTYQAYDEGRCDAVTSDRSQLVSRRTTLSEPDAHVILDAVLSKEPLAPAVAQGDSQLRDVISWVVYATIQAEEFGIDSTNIDTFADSEDPTIARLLGQEGELGAALGLPNDFAVSVISNVGSYGEIYNRNLGPDTSFNLDRGLNALWTEGGLLYSPPFR
ncbi:MAG: amino acid ABC transporter substrate-binding protein [Chloroflexota bacterium]